MGSRLRRHAVVPPLALWFVCVAAPVLAQASAPVDRTAAAREAQPAAARRPASAARPGRPAARARGASRSASAAVRGRAAARSDASSPAAAPTVEAATSAPRAKSVRERQAEALTDAREGRLVPPGEGQPRN